MRASRMGVPIALGLAAAFFQATAIGQTSPPPQEPPAQPPQPPGTQPPPAGQPPANQPPPPQPPPPGYQQPPPGYQQPPPGYQQPPPPDYQPPPPGYQQQQPGYQQQPPGYQQPPPGYQPSPGTYQQPPPGTYQQPPPGTYPPGYGYAPQPPPPPSAPPRTYGFLALPYLGVASHVGDTGANLKAAGTIGVLLGGRLNPSVSLNGELRVDGLNFRNVPANEDWQGAETDLVFSPLFHVPFPAGELVVGPKLGLFGRQEKDTLNGAGNGTYSQNGVSAGVNAGAFFAVNRVMSLGGMFSFTIRDAANDCYTPPGGTQHCTKGDYPSEKVLGFHGGMLF